MSLNLEELVKKLEAYRKSPEGIKAAEKTRLKFKKSKALAFPTTAAAAAAAPRPLRCFLIPALTGSAFTTAAARSKVKVKKSAATTVTEAQCLRDQKNRKGNETKRRKRQNKQPSKQKTYSKKMEKEMKQKEERKRDKTNNQAKRPTAPGLRAWSPTALLSRPGRA